VYRQNAVNLHMAGCVLVDCIWLYTRPAVCIAYLYFLTIHTAGLVQVTAFCLYTRPAMCIASFYHRIIIIFVYLEQLATVIRALSKTCWDDAGTV